MQLHSLKQKVVKTLSAFCFWHSENESSFSYCIVSTICSNITCWAAWADFFFSFSSFFSQHVCLIHWCLWDCNQHCCLCLTHFNLSWNWDVSSDTFILCMLCIVCAFCESLVLMTDWLRCVWWHIYPACALHCVCFAWESCFHGWLISTQVGIEMCLMIVLPGI